MADDKYSFLKVPQEHYYEFYSNGPKGIVKKVVRYSLIQEKPYKIFNLGFRDWDSKKLDVMIGSTPITMIDKRYWQRLPIQSLIF